MTQTAWQLPGRGMTYYSFGINQTGSKNRMAKLTEPLVWEIKFGKYAKKPAEWVSRKFEISLVHVKQLRAGKRWQHVTIDYLPQRGTSASN